MKTIFWKDQFEGKAKGGCFARNDLFKFFKRLKEAGEVPVGIIIDDDWNLEILLKDEKT